MAEKVQTNVLGMSPNCSATVVHMNQKKVNKARGLRIKKLVEERGYHLHGGMSALARELGVNRRVPYEWLAGEEMSYAGLQKLAAFFDTTPEWILAQAGPMHPEHPAPGADADLPPGRLLDQDDDEARRERS
jgi:transcriptional regulator with XRE-family HTH domain